MASKWPGFGPPSTPEEYGRILRDETARWRQVIAASGVRLE